MAATIAIATGYDKSGRIKRTTRLGSEAAAGEANTWRTFAEASVLADGSGMVRVIRDGRTIHRFEFGPEGQEG